MVCGTTLVEAAGPKARKSLKQEQLARSEGNLDSTCRHAELTSVLMRHLHADEERECAHVLLEIVKDGTYWPRRQVEQNCDAHESPRT